MNRIYSKGISNQGRKLYNLLVKGPLAAKEIASRLHKHQSAIYRLAHYLVEIGLITKSNQRPLTFEILPPKEGQENYLAYQKDKVSDLLSFVYPNTTSSPTKNYHFSFMQGRENIFARVADDLKTASNDAHFIVLGLPIVVSPELLLEQKRAVERGISIKIIVQEFSPENINTLTSWQKQGLELRLGKPIGFHLLLIDNYISYLMSYDKDDKTKRYAVRIYHQQINVQLQKIFSSVWKKSKSINL